MSMERVKPWLALSLKGLMAARFDTEAEANQYAKDRAATNLCTFTVAKVARVYEPTGAVVEREMTTFGGAADPVAVDVRSTEVTEAANG